MDIVIQAELQPHLTVIVYSERAPGSQKVGPSGADRSSEGFQEFEHRCGSEKCLWTFRMPVDKMPPGIPRLGRDLFGATEALPRPTRLRSPVAKSPSPAGLNCSSRGDISPSVGPAKFPSGLSPRERQFRPADEGFLAAEGKGREIERRSPLTLTLTVKCSSRSVERARITGAMTTELRYAAGNKNQREKVINHVYIW
ncbi:hypothetical protein Bbelb_143180 [Branchiostoma belcheri]|nr:hypothetical protein Bbelb_143180 [Branchiostoma belcheri]